MARSRLVERGAGAVEWLGATVVAVLIVLGLVVAAPGVGQSIAAGVDRAICTLTQLGGGGGGCGTAIRDIEPTGDPYLSRAWTRADVTRGNLVFLGDSYGAGEGAENYASGTDEEGEHPWYDFWSSGEPPARNTCHRSGNAAFHATSDAWFGGDNSSFVSCSGATTSDYWEETQGNSEDPQRDALNEDTSMVVVSMGGNDMDFSAVLRSCIRGSGVCWEEWDTPVDPDDPESLSPYEQNLIDLFGTEPGGGNLGEMYADIRARTGDAAHVVIVGYPQLFDDDYGARLNTSPGMSPYPFQEHGWLWPEQTTWLNDKSADLNAHLRAHAEYYGFTFIDPTEAFAGHGVGSDDPWLLSLGFTGPRGMPPEAFHPTARGQEEIARLIDEHLRSLP